MFQKIFAHDMHTEKMYSSDELFQRSWEVYLGVYLGVY